MGCVPSRAIATVEWIHLECFDHFDQENAFRFSLHHQKIRFLLPVALWSTHHPIDKFDSQENKPLVRRKGYTTSTGRHEISLRRGGAKGALANPPRIPKNPAVIKPSLDIFNLSYTSPAYHLGFRHAPTRQQGAVRGRTSSLLSAMRRASL